MRKKWSLTQCKLVDQHIHRLFYHYYYTIIVSQKVIVGCDSVVTHVKECVAEHS